MIINKNIKDRAYRNFFYNVLSNEIAIRGGSPSLSFTLLIRYYQFFNKPKLFYFGERLVQGMALWPALSETYYLPMAEVKRRLKIWGYR